MSNKEYNTGILIAEISDIQKRLDKLEIDITYIKDQLNTKPYREELESWTEITQSKIDLHTLQTAAIKKQVDSIRAKPNLSNFLEKKSKLVGICIGIASFLYVLAKNILGWF